MALTARCTTRTWRSSIRTSPASRFTRDDDTGNSHDIWTRGHYREGSTCLRLLPFLRRYIPEGSEVNDYGSGTGRAEPGLLEFCDRVNMVDFADAALEDEARALIGDRLT